MLHPRSPVPLPASLSGVGTEWAGLVGAFLSHASSVPAHMSAVGAVAPASPAFLALKGMIFLLLGRRELANDAASLLAEARANLSARPCEHDRMLVEALAAWVAGAPSRAAAICDDIAARFPGDALAVKLAQAIRFLYGDSAGMRRSADAHIAAFADDHPFAGYAHGLHAFACEETGDFTLAERAGTRALELAPDDAWALHAVAHVHEMRGHAQKGRDWLAPRQDAFSHCSTFRHHVWWHYALFELELGNIERVLALYDQEIRREHTDDYRDIANAVSLLARLEGENVNVGHRWDELAAIAERRIEDGCVVFADLHYLLALLACGRNEAADRLIERMSQAGDGSEFGDVAVRAGATTGTGLAAMKRGHHEDAFRRLIAAQCALTSIGGSHAQRDVFERLTIDAALRAGHTGDARTLIKARAQRRGAFDRFGFERLVRCGPVPVAAPQPTAAAF